MTTSHLHCWALALIVSFIISGVTQAANRLAVADQAGPSLKILSFASNENASVIWEWNPRKDPGLTGAMASSFAAIDECKPVEGGRMILANASGGGVAAVDVATGRAKWCAHPPSGGAGPHSSAILPDGRIAVANSTGMDALQLIDLNGHPLNPAKQKVVKALPVSGAHGVVWDEKRQALFVLGYTNLLKVAYLPETMSVKVLKTWNFAAACGDAWGHDLLPDGRGGYFFANGSAVWRFDPDRGTFECVRQIRNVKSFSRDALQGDLVTFPRQGWWTDRLVVIGTNGIVRTLGPFPKARIYKARWLP